MFLQIPTNSQSNTGYRKSRECENFIKAETKSPSNKLTPRAKTQMESNFEEIIVMENQKIKNEHWQELRSKNKAIYRRSYHSSVIYSDYLYVYGGYEINLGILSDLYRINLKPLNNEYIWEKIEMKKGHYNNRSINYPGCLFRHTAITYNNCMYIFGGQKGSTANTDKLYKFDFETEEFEELQYTTDGFDIYPIDSHSANLWIKEENNTFMVINFGFIGGNIGTYTNAIWQYNFEKSVWNELYSHNPSESNLVPACRMGQSSVIHNNMLYVFGGTDGDIRFNDFWRFDLVERAWQMIDITLNIPEPRNGHSMNLYEGLLIIFGGIHDIAHEKNDIQVFHLSRNEWIKIEEENFYQMVMSPPQLQASEKVKSPLQSHVSSVRGTLFKTLTPKRGESTFNDMNIHMNTHPDKYSASKVAGKKVIYSSFTKFKPMMNTPKSMSYISQQNIAGNNTKILRNEKISLNNSPNKEPVINSRQLKKQKNFQIEKMMLLSNFEVGDEEKSSFRGHSPTTIAMQNSIENISNSLLSSKNDTKDSNSCKKPEYFNNIKIEMVVSNSPINNKFLGRKPCARDGHSSTIFDDKMIIFGGDRHKMCFNDLYALDLNHIIKVVGKQSN